MWGPLQLGAWGKFPPLPLPPPPPRLLSCPAKMFLTEVEKTRAKETEFAPSPEELVRSFFENVLPENNSSYAVLHYINGSTEPLKRLLKRHGIRTTTKPIRTLEQHFPPRKDRPLPEKQTDVVYKIDCADCCWSYIGETGGALGTRKKGT